MFAQTLMSMPVTKTVAVGEGLPEVLRLMHELEVWWRELGLDEEVGSAVSLALDEVLSNVLRHGQPAGCPPAVEVTFRAGEGTFEFEVSDACAAYNPLLRADPNLDVPLMERKAGGLGVFLVKQLADEVEYARRDDRNHFWFRKRLPGPSAGMK